MRIGQSTDIHQLVEGRKLILGGVVVPFEKGLLGHSDADVLCHVVGEAIIGAMGMGDLGKHFPDTDERYHNISSLLILKEINKMMIDNNYEIGNVDALIIIEKPKLANYIPKMQENIANIFNCPLNCINIKATRGEKLGFVGEGKGVVGQAVVLLKGREDEKSKG